GLPEASPGYRTHRLMPLRSWPIRLLRGARSRDGSRSIRPAPETISLVTRRAQPAAATVARLTITAVVAFVVARLVTDTAYPVIAPLTAMLVVQVTLYRTFWSALARRQRGRRCPGRVGTLPCPRAHLVEPRHHGRGRADHR